MPAQSWQEPPPAPPKPGVTGYPIEALPPRKKPSGHSRKSKHQQSQVPRSGDATAATTPGPDSKRESSVESDYAFETSSDLAPSSRAPTPPPSGEEKFKIRLKTNVLGPNGAPESHVRRRRSGRLAGSEDVNYYEKARAALGLVNRPGSAKRQHPDTPGTPPPSSTPPSLSATAAATRTPEHGRKPKKIKFSSYVTLWSLFCIRPSLRLF